MSDSASFKTEFKESEDFSLKLNVEETFNTDLSDNEEFNAEFTESEAFSMTFNAEETFDTEMTQIVRVTTSDHRELTHRDAAEQHPIASITYLEPELGVRPSTALSNQDIQSILNA